jgi:hypothetical protein
MLIPYHGSARYGAHKNVIFSMNVEQLEWLQAHAFNGGMQLQRPASAYGFMKSDFQVIPLSSIFCFVFVSCRSPSCHPVLFFIP